MNDRIKGTLENITLNKEQKDRILSNIKAKVSKPKKSAARIIKTAAVAAVLCMLFAVTVVAADYAGIFTSNELVGDTVKTAVYADCDKHVEFTVEELLSDMNTVYLAVHYKANDRAGQKWLAELSPTGDDLNTDDDYDNFGFYISPDFKDNNTRLYGVNWGAGATELEEYHTRKERRFVVKLVATEDYWGTNNIVFKYGMTGGIRSTVLDVTTNIEKEIHILDNSCAPEKLYKPAKAVLSPLSLIIYGEDSGIFEKGQYDTDYGTYYYSWIKEEETIDSLYIVFTNGRKADLFREGNNVNDGDISYMGAMNHSAEEGLMLIASTSFCEPIDTETVAGIELDGVYYSFE